MAVVEPSNYFTYGSFVLLVDRLLEHVEETKMQRAVNEQTMKDLELARTSQTKILFNEDHMETTLKTEHTSYLLSKYEDLEKKYPVALAEKEQFELKHKLLSEENKTLRCDLVKVNRDRVTAQSKVCEVEAKLSVHCKGKEACLEKIELLQNKFTDLSKTYSSLCLNIGALEHSFTGARMVQKKLKFLVRHSNCIINDLQGQIKEKNQALVKLKAAQLRDDPAVLNQVKMLETLPVDKQIISSLQHQLTEKTSEIVQLQKLLQTTKMSAQELSGVFLVERTRCDEQTSQLEEQSLRLQTEVVLVRAAVTEKERENESLVSNLNESNDKVSDVLSELEILKNMIVSRETSDTAIEATISVTDAACQNDPTYFEFETQKAFIDQSVSCHLVTEDMECQTEEVFFLTKSPTSPLHVTNTSKRSPPISPFHSEESTAKRLRNDPDFEMVVEDISPSPLPLLKRLSLKFTSPIPLRQGVREEGCDGDGHNVTYATTDELSLEMFEDGSHSIIVTGDFEEEFPGINQTLDVEDEPKTPEHLVEKEPKTPEHLVDNEANRLARSSAGYRNDPDYSPIESPPVEPTVTSSESVTEIKESPLLGDRTSSLGTAGNDSGIVEDYSKTPVQERSVITVVESSSSDSDEQAVAPRSQSKVKPAVDRVLNFAFRHVNSVMLQRPEKLKLYKASLSKSPKCERSALRQQRVSPTTLRDSCPTAISTLVPKESFLPPLQEIEISSDFILQSAEPSVCDQDSSDRTASENDYSFTQVARILKTAKTQIGEIRSTK